ncbi:MAG: bifunctional DNA-formamidopyrimidine glycosylase/DNA-(apurinic or apyrimidinic site) lyase [Dehalococcoidia bacterium]
MPELPEVENTRRYLVEAGLVGRTITGASIGWPKSLKQPDLEDFLLDLPGRQVTEVGRRGKYLLVNLDTQDTLVLHLGMTGGLRIYPQSDEPDPMVRHHFTLDDRWELRFVDPRKFGHIWLTKDWAATLPPFGPEPLEPNFTAEVLAGQLHGRNAPIKAILLEQSIIAGLGNLYADESLYLAGVHPLRPASELTAKEILGLRDSIVGSLSAALDLYDRSRVESGPIPPFGLSTWTIPRKGGESCPTCGGAIAGIRVRGRGTYYCRGCQPEG